MWDAYASTNMKPVYETRSGHKRGRRSLVMVWLTAPVLAVSALTAAVALPPGSMTAPEPVQTGHHHFEDAFREARCSVPLLDGIKRLKEEAGHDGHADVAIYEAICPGGRRVTVTCTERTCRADRPPRDEDDL